MNKKIMCLSLLFLFFCADSFLNNVLFASRLKNPAGNPCEFVSFVKEAYIRFYSIKKKNPKDWDDLWPQITASAKDSAYLIDDSFKRNGLILTADANFRGKNIPVAYIMGSGKIWNVHSENSPDLENWEVRSDHETAFRFFPSEAEEKVAIADLMKKVKPKKFFGIDINLRKSYFLNKWRFYHEDSFYQLMPFISDSSLSMVFRRECAETLSVIPDAGRFEKALPEIDRIIQNEKKFNQDEDAGRNIFIETLFELKKTITGSNRY